MKQVFEEYISFSWSLFSMILTDNQTR